MAFKGCIGLSSYTIPSTVKVVYKGSFEGCTNIKSIVLKEGVEIFYGSNVSANLEKITLPKSLIKLDGNQFINTKWYKNSKAGWVYLGKHLIDFKEDKTHKASKITSYTVKAGTVSINDEAFNNMTRLSKLTLPKSIIYYNYDEDYAGKYDYLKTGSGSNLENTFWYLNQPNGIVYVGSVAFRLKNVYASFLLNVRYGTKEEVEINLKKQELYKKYKLATFSTINFKNGTVSIANNFADGANTDNFNLKYTLPSSVKLIGSKAFYHNYYRIQKFTWSTNLKYVESRAFATGSVEQNKLFKNFPANADVIGDSLLYAEINQINAKTKWTVDKLISKYIDYDNNSKTLILKSNIPYLEKIENIYLKDNMYDTFYENVIVPDDFVCIADYLFGYGNWSNPNLTFTKLITDDAGDEYEQNGVFKKNTKTGEWDTIELGNYTNYPFGLWNRDNYKITWDSKIGFWKAEDKIE
jgi:hypothetical protein